MTFRHRLNDLPTQALKIEDVVHFFVYSHVSEVDMSEVDLLWE